eukprot:gene18549-37803_t
MPVCAGLCDALVKRSERAGDTPDDAKIKAMFVPVYAALGITIVCGVPTHHAYTQLSVVGLVVCVVVLLRRRPGGLRGGAPPSSAWWSAWWCSSVVGLVVCVVVLL